MDSNTSEQALRREAIRRYLGGGRRKQICIDLDRSPSWFDKWLAEFWENPRTDFADHSRTPHHSPQQTPDTVAQAIVAIRQSLEAATTPATRYGLIGAVTIQKCLDDLGLEPPSASTIQRILRAHHLTHPIGAGNDAAYYPWLTPWAVNAIQATDIITKHIRGGEAIENFHTIDLYSHAIARNCYGAKSAAITGEHLRATWSKLGLPQIHQFDNEAAFNGGHTHRRVIGQVVRLCLFCGIEPLFTPFYEPKRNHQIETFHSLWVKGFWSRQEFRNLAHVQAESPLFEHWYHQHYRPPSVGKTPAQMRRGASIVCLTRDLQRLIPEGRLPITAGRIHFMRKVQPTGEIELLNETWLIGEPWIGEYVRATVNTWKQLLTIWHKADATQDWRLVKTRQFRLKESVQPVLPAFHRNRTRCLDCLPD
jgi:transposase-like protein